MILKSIGDTYQFGGYTGALKKSYEMVDASKFQLVHWILYVAGYSCCTADIMERCGINPSEKDQKDKRLLKEANK